jgi:cytochrome d ubiquinol oxidase subunit I
MGPIRLRRRAGRLGHHRGRRQPYTVYGLLRTSDSLAAGRAEAVGASLIAFIIVYFVVFGAGVFYILR